MGFILPDFIICPHCKSPLTVDGKSLVCTGEKPHTYDIAKEGYVNLLPPGRAKNSHTGDDADMIKAREAFLSGGGYDRYSREAAELAAEVLCQVSAVPGSLETSDEAVPISASGGSPDDLPSFNLRITAESASALRRHVRQQTISYAQLNRSMPAGATRPISASGGIPVLVDAGCGEGRHTVNMAKALADALGTHVIAAGFDASKFGVRAAAKRYVKNGCPQNGVTPVFAAANIFSLPVSDECADVFTSLFAPLPEDEVRRTLRPGGVLVICAAGPDHLGEMRSVLYENPIPSGGGAAVPDGFTVVREKIIKYSIPLNSNEEIMSLFTMTPFYYNAPSEGRAKLESLSSMTVTVQVKCTAAVKNQS